MKNEDGWKKKIEISSSGAEIWTATNVANLWEGTFPHSQM